MDGDGNTEPLHVRIDRKRQGNFLTKSLNCSIFKVPRNLRKVNEAAYEPQAISIGPYHHGKDHLKTMEVFKLYYLNAILHRRNETSVERYVKALDRVKEEARRYYSEPLDHFGGDEKFVEMMLLDGCFIVELIQASSFEEQRVREDPLLSHYILRTVLRDLLLVENQLPLFILWMLFEMTVMPDQPKNFLEMAISLFSINKIMPGSPETITGMPKHIQVVEHLLGLLHDKWIGYSRLKSPEEVNSPDKLPSSSYSRLKSPEEVGSAPKPTSAPVPAVSLGHDRKNIGKCPFIPSATELNEAGVKFKKMLGRCWVNPEAQLKGSAPVPLSGSASAPVLAVSLVRDRKKIGKCPFIPSATELKEAGVKFKNMEGRSSLFDITFDKGEGVLSIPTLEIKDETESVLRNLVAYEQCYSDSSLGSHGFTDYVTFIDCLINTEKDVELLCKHKIIDSWLGDYQVVTAIFNRIRDYVLIAEDFRYAETFKQLNHYSNRYWNQWFANLKHNYFNTPWASISVVAAVFLLLLTVLQSIYAALSYHHPKK